MLALETNQKQGRSLNILRSLDIVAALITETEIHSVQASSPIFNGYEIFLSRDFSILNGITQ